MIQQKKLNILLVEDTKMDFLALERTLTKTHDNLNITHCESGDQVLELMNELGDPTTSNKRLAFPDFIFLDLNLPGTSGKEVLKTLKQQDIYKAIPILIFSTSNNPKDIQDCYEAGANGYIQKPMEYSDMAKEIKCVSNYWFKCSKLPERSLR